jgi:hypothetical protein
MTDPQRELSFRTFDVEMFFARRLKEHGKTVFQGLSDPTISKDRIRAAIIAAKCDCAIIGRNPKTHKPETYQQLFERHFGERLVPKTKGK